MRDPILRIHDTDTWKIKQYMDRFLTPLLCSQSLSQKLHCIKHSQYPFTLCSCKIRQQMHSKVIYQAKWLQSCHKSQWHLLNWSNLYVFQMQDAKASSFIKMRLTAKGLTYISFVRELVTDDGQISADTTFDHKNIG